MPVFLVDTSVLVKRYVAEEGTAWTTALFESPDDVFCVSHLTRLELTAAMLRRSRSDPANADAIQRALEIAMMDLAYDFLEVPIDERAIGLADEVVRQHFLRAGDAIQLASALIVSSALGATTFIAADIELLRAAKAAGLQVDSPLESRS